MESKQQVSSNEETKGEINQIIQKQTIIGYPGIKQQLINSGDFPSSQINYHKISIAPMLEITNVHFRYLMRLLTKYSTLYTEMIHCNAILHHIKGYQEFLKFNPIEHPVVLQLGGNDPEQMIQCAKLCQEMGYDEINLNVGCPSPRVQHGSFGACLMKEPELVAKIMKSLKNATTIPCTVKCRLGVDEMDSYDFAKNFIQIVSTQGEVSHFIIHARKAFLKGLNPAENRTIPPLKYDYVLQLKKDFPHLQISINGGFKTSEQITDILKEDNQLTGCMVGRVAYETPWQLSDYDRIFYGKQNQGFSRREILQMWGDYGEYVYNENPQQSLSVIVKPIINLFANEKYSAKYRAFLSDKQQFSKYNGFKEFMDACIADFEIYNKNVLDMRPPMPEKDAII